MPDYYDDDDSASTILGIEGSIWKMGKNAVTGRIYWRKKWVYADKNKIFQWSSEKKPGKSIKANHELDIEKCRIELCDLREFSIKIIDKSSGYSVVLAFDTEEDCNLWLSVILASEEDDSEEGDDTSNASDLFQEFEYSNEEKEPLETEAQLMFGSNSEIEETINHQIDNLDETDNLFTETAAEGQFVNEISDFQQNIDELELGKSKQLGNTPKTPDMVNSRKVVDSPVVSSPGSALSNTSSLSASPMGFNQPIGSPLQSINQLLRNDVDRKHGPLWKMKKVPLSSAIKWKKKWCYADLDKFLQWHSDHAPKTTKKMPHQAFASNQMIVMPVSVRQFAFSITDRVSKTTLTFAADSSLEYKQWMKILNPIYIDDTSTNNTVATAPQIEDSVMDEDDTHISFRPLEQDVILDFFEKYSINEDENDLQIEQHQIKNLLESLNDFGYMYINPRAGAFIYEEFGFAPGSTISLNEFLSWRKLHHERCRNDDTSDQPSMSQGEDVTYLQECNHFIGFIDVQVQDIKQEISRMLSINVPRMESLRVEPPRQPSFEEDWNGIYQDHLDRVAGLHTTVDVKEGIDSIIMTSKIRKGPRSSTTDSLAESSLNQSSGFLGSTNDDESTINSNASDDISTQYNADDSGIQKLLELQAVIGAFYQSALVGTKRIIDEYTLPSNLKTINTVMELMGVKDLSLNSQQDIYGYDGMMFTVVDTPVFLGDNENSILNFDSKYSVVTDDLRRKVATHDIRGKELLDEAVLQMCSNYLEMIAMKKHNPAGARRLYGDLSTSFVKISTLLSTIVDYAGFRISIVCPIEIDEMHTLIYGKPSRQAYQAGQSDHFINAAANLLHPIIYQLSDHLNISTINIPISPLPGGNIELLARNLQIHLGSDERLYAMGVDSLTPPDILKPFSHDINTKRLRPEFFQNLHYKIPSASTLAAFQDEGGNLPEHIIQYGDALETLYTEKLRSVAAQLDSLLVLPLDSTSLTKYIHNRGLNIRHLGSLYKLCNQKSVRQTLLAEATARSFNNILCSTLRFFTKKNKLESLDLEVDPERHMGNAQLFFDISKKSNDNRSEIILDLFNMLLGGSQDGRKFWSGPLLDVLKLRFDISMDVDVLYSGVHPPQLFQAAQFHTGTVFKDDPFWHFHEKAFPIPFVKEDILDTCVPNLKHRLPFPGKYQEMDRMGELFLLSGLYTEAANIFRIRLSSHLTALGGIPSLEAQSTIANTVFKFATTLYLAKQYEASKSVITDYLCHNSKFTMIAGRMISLLMCVEFEIGYVDKAMVYFEAATNVYNFILGPRHPIHCLHIITLADMYMSHGAIQHAKSMIILVHETTRMLLGEAHLTHTMVGQKLGIIYMKEESYTLASEIFSNVLQSLESFSRRNVILIKDIAECMYVLTRSLVMSGEVQSAIDSAGKCIQAYCSIYPTVVAPRVISCLILLGDLYASKREIPAALEIFKDAWIALKSRPRDFQDLGSVLAEICRKLFFNLHSSETLATRSLLEIIAKEVLVKLEKGFLAVEDWSKACSKIFSELWAGDVKEYYQSLISILQKQECDGDPNSLCPGPDGVCIAGIPFYALKAAVIFKLISATNS